MQIPSSFIASPVSAQVKTSSQAALQQKNQQDRLEKTESVTQTEESDQNKGRSFDRNLELNSAQQVETIQKGAEMSVENQVDNVPSHSNPAVSKYLDTQYAQTKREDSLVGIDIFV